MTQPPTLMDARKLGERIGLPYKTIAHLAGLSPAPFTSIRVSDRTLLVDVDQVKTFLAERTRLIGQI